MSELLSERARAYLDAIEADRQAALALSEQRAEEAKLLQARLEGFQAAVKMLGGNSAFANTSAIPRSQRSGAAPGGVDRARTVIFRPGDDSAPNCQSHRLQPRGHRSGIEPYGERRSGASGKGGWMGNRHDRPRS